MQFSLVPFAVSIFAVSISGELLSAKTTREFGIRGIPTLMIFKDGAKKDTKVGLLTKSELTSFLDSNI